MGIDKGKWFTYKQAATDVQVFEDYQKNYIKLKIVRCCKRSAGLVCYEREVKGKVAWGFITAQ